MGEKSVYENGTVKEQGIYFQNKLFYGRYFFRQYYYDVGVNWGHAETITLFINNPTYVLYSMQNDYTLRVKDRTSGLTVYEGELENDQYHGFGTLFTFKEGHATPYYRGNWNHNQFEGEWDIYMNEEIFSSYIFENGTAKHPLSVEKNRKICLENLRNQCQSEALLDIYNKAERNIYRYMEWKKHPEWAYSPILVFTGFITEQNEKCLE